MRNYLLIVAVLYWLAAGMADALGDALHPGDDPGARMTAAGEEIRQLRNEAAGRSVYDADAVSAGRLYQRLAKREQAAGQYQQAAAHYATALRLLEPYLEAQSLEWLELCTAAGRVLTELGRWQDAERWLHRAWRHCPPESEKHRGAAIQIHDALGALFSTQEAYHQAEPFYQTAYALAGRHYGPGHPRTLAIGDDLGQLYLAAKRLEEGERFYRELLVHPAAPGLRAAMLSHLGSIVALNGRSIEARDLLEEAMQAASLEGRESLAVADVMMSQSALAMATGDPDEAKNRAQIALAMRVRLAGQGHPVVAEVYDAMAAACVWQEQYQKAHYFLSRASAVYEETHGRKSRKAGLALCGLARVYTRQGRIPEAKEAYRQALPIFVELDGLGSPDVLAVQRALAALDRDD